jgi:predicted CXXCH cytochrome family protein
MEACHVGTFDASLVGHSTQMENKGNRAMKTTSKLTSPLTTLLAGLVLLISGNTVMAGVTDTKHNLGSGNTAGSNFYSGTTEVCVFCHTPHGADASAAVPLWNRNLAVPSTYQTYDTLGTTSLDGSVAKVGSVSIACLSCHDGAQAMDSVINEPGSGSTTAFSTGQSWSGFNSPQGVANLNKDLKNDHPIGIQYGGGGQSVGAETATLKDPDFKQTQNAKINGTTVWWVDTTIGTNGVREKTDMQLYTRDSTDTLISGNAQPFVECASCHDPHTTNTTFLRIENDNSDVCLACHTK